jgi:hypothetical protein
VEGLFGVIFRLKVKGRTYQGIQWPVNEGSFVVRKNHGQLLVRSPESSAEGGESWPSEKKQSL